LQATLLNVQHIEADAFDLMERPAERKSLRGA
jgi:hypothetical protein